MTNNRWAILAVTMLICACILAANGDGLALAAFIMFVIATHRVMVGGGDDR